MSTLENVSVLSLRRWSAEEEEAIAEIRGRLKDDLAQVAQNPEVVGDRKILRFYRGHNGDIDKATEMMRGFLSWRQQRNVDQIRHNIVHQGFDEPRKFPNGEKIMSLMPQVVIDASARDKLGAPICLEQYKFSPSAVFKAVSLDEYIEFVIYSLEYKSIILEQLSHERELENRQRLEDLLNKAKSSNVITKEQLAELQKPYGVTMHTCVIRDMAGVGFEHLSSQGMDIIKAVIGKLLIILFHIVIIRLGVASDNYPEMMHKCHMINTPWLFNTVWWVIKGWLAPRTIAKVNVLGSSFMDTLLHEIESHALFSNLGGNFTHEPRPFPFDRSINGPLHNNQQQSTESDDHQSGN